MPQISMERSILYTRGGALDKLLDSVFDMAMLLDVHCNILYLSASNQKVLPNPQQFIGKPVSLLDKYSPFQQVASTGQSVEGLAVEMYGHRGFSNLYPLVEDGQIIGVLSYIYFQNRSAIEQILAQRTNHPEGRQPDDYRQVSLVTRSYDFSDFLGDSPLVKQMLDRCRQAAASDYPVLLIGETGTGKEILASGIHAARHPKCFAPYVAINCTAIPENLMESELFGHEKGAFTGAHQRKLGKFEQAGEGDVLLDEIGDMNLSLQSKLLRALESREFERVGGQKLIPFRANIIAATNKNLPALVEAGQFRADLYYRLSVIEVFLVPLRKRPEDIPLLVDHFLQNRSGSLRFTRQAMEFLQRYPWPGNVRQLRNLVYRLLALSSGEQITGERVMQELSTGQESYSWALSQPSAPQPAPEMEHSPRTLEQLERQAIAQALEHCQRNISLAARQLGISRATLYKKMEKFHL